ncbi:MAG: zinc-ribbon domain-containing protein [Myxococcales bacterium]|nr:zinc-ribbon domain-containing protein [Myxococcales bacterium]
MNFLCENCKQKYHVADEKLRGREVTKFKCKKCEHIIEVRGDAVGQGDDTEIGSAATAMPSSVPPPSAAVPKAPVSPAKPTGTGLPTAGAPKPAPSPAKPAGTGFPAAGASKPTGTGLPTAGAPKPASTLPTSAARPAATAAAPASAPKPTGSSLPTAGATARAVAAAPAAAPKPTPAVRAVEAAPKPAAASALRSSITAAGTTASQEANAPKRTSSSASTSALLNPSETGWYAGIREVPVGPLTRVELATKIDSGDITSDTLVWREGLDDWRPLSAVNELSDLLREASKRVSDTMLGTQSKRPPSNVVPLSRANTQKEQEEPEESTRLTSLSDLIATAEGGPAPKKAPKPEPAIAPTPKAEAKPEPKPEPKPAPKAEPEPNLASTDLDDEFFSGAKKSAAAAPAAAAIPPTAAMPAVAKPAVAPFGDIPAAPLAPTAPSANATALLPSIPPAAEQKESKKGGVPMGVVVVLGGLIVLAGGGGLYMGTRINQQQPQQQPAQPATQPVATPTQPRLDPRVGEQINVHEPANEPAQQPTPNTATGPAQPTPNAGTTPTPSTGGSHASGGSHARPSTATSTGTNRGTTTGLTAEQLQQMQAQLGTAPSGVGTASGGGPVGSARTANTGLSGSGSEAPAGPTGGARAGQVLEVFRRTNVVGSCWQTQITRNPAHPPERITVTLTINTTGRATNVAVAGSNDPALSTCIQNRARSQNYGPGGNIDAQATFNLAIGS